METNFVIGQQYQVIADASVLPQKAAIYAGETGTLERIDPVPNAGNYYVLKFGDDTAAYRANEIRKV